MDIMNTAVVVRFDTIGGSAYCPPDEFHFLGFYPPEEREPEKFVGDVAVYLDDEEVEFLTTLGMLTDKNFPVLLKQVDNATAEWWNDYQCVVQDYYGMMNSNLF